MVGVQVSANMLAVVENKGEGTVCMGPLGEHGQARSRACSSGVPRNGNKTFSFLCIAGLVIMKRRLHQPCLGDCLHRSCFLYSRNACMGKLFDLELIYCNQSFSFSSRPPSSCKRATPDFKLDHMSALIACRTHQKQQGQTNTEVR